MDWPEVPLHVIDFEGSRKSGVLEYGAATLQDGAITQTRTRLCKPAGPVAPGETRCHGLSADNLAEQPAFAEDFSFFRSLRQTGLLAAHNAVVERRLLSDLWPHPGAVPDFCAEEAPAAIAEWGPWVDSCALYRRIYPDLPEYALEFLIETFSLNDALEDLARAHCPEGRKQPHCALYDALGAALLLQRLQEDALTRTISLRQFCRLADPFAAANPESSSFL